MRGRGYLPGGLTTLALTVVLAACGGGDDEGSSGGGAAPTKDNPVKVSVGTGYWVGDAPLFVAAGMNLDQRHGIDLSMKLLTGIDEYTPPWVAGDIDVSMTVPEFTATMLQGRPGETVAVVNKSDGADKIVGTVDSLKDLVGKKFAFRLDDYTPAFVLPALKQAGVSLDDIDQVSIGSDEGPQALAAGRVDATASFEPLLSQALSKTKGINTLYTTKGADDLSIVESMIVSKDFAASPAAVEALLETYQAGVEALRDRPAEAIPIAAKGMDTPVKDFEVAFGGADIYDLQQSQKLMKSGGFLAAAKDYLDTLGKVGTYEAGPLFETTKDSVNTSYAASVLGADGS